ncbi:ABC transporter permease [Occallatibacter savannae]|uniref:ABC transporter permease n=1 Tax=Occallatibacter savannae TaxID=1002691 RepID=UPI000D68CA62|nr:ABC transporter permease [Occallatibacter savannae]
MTSLLQDIRFGIRQLTKMPGFSLTAIVSLALGIGATTAVFSVVYAILLDPYPYKDPERMVHMRLTMPSGELNGFGVTGTQWQELRKSPVVEDSFMEDDWSLTVTGADLPENVNAVYLTSNAFNFLGVPMPLGRGLQPSDAIDGQDPAPVVVLSHKFWTRHYAADSSVIGKTIQLMRKNYTIVGVSSSRFTWGDADVYLPLKVTGDQVKGYYAGVRLKPGITHSQADSALEPLIKQFAKENPKHFPPNFMHLHVVGLNEDFVKQLGGTLYLLFGAVALLLLIGCGNVSILLLARATARQHEFALRSAIGASSRRIIAQLLTEALLLSVTGALLGLALAYKTVDLIVANLPEFSFPHEAAIHVNLPVLVFCVIVAVSTGVLFGLWPALQLSHPEVSQIMKANTRKSTGDVRGRKAHAILIGGQIALTLLMMAGAGAAIEGFLKVANVNLGYDPHNIMSVGIPIHDGTYETWPKRAAYFEKMYDKVAAVPGVKLAAISSNATPPSNGFDAHLQVVGKPTDADQPFRFNMVSKDYFPALRIPLAQGRIWDEAETHRGAPLMVVNQTFAKRYFPAGDAIGKAVKVMELKPQPPYLLIAPGAENGFQIVGIVSDKLDDGLSKPVLPETFVPYTAVMGMYTQILVRSDVPPLTLLHAVRVAVNSVDSDQQTNDDVRDLEHWITRLPEYARGQLVAWLFGAFAALALALASVGLYSVVAYTVVQRTNEFGIRVALGAERSHVLGLVFRSTVASVGAGIIAGVVLTVTLNKVMASWSAESVRDPGLLIGATLTLSVVATLASILPAWRAARVNPMVAIRYE